MLSSNSILSPTERPAPVESGLQLPSRAGLDIGLLSTIAEDACKRLGLPLDRAQVSVTRGWPWDPITPRNARETVAYFNQLERVLVEARRIASSRSTHPGQGVALGAISGYLAQERLALERDLTALLSMTERPLEVLREFLRISGVGAKPEIVSILLGINEESIGGDLSRHPSCQREALFGKGGFMYQPSEPQELWQIFSLLSLREGSKFYDLGSGYGHVLFCGAVLRPDITFKGIELMPVRVAECEAARSRHGIENLSFVAGDVTQGGFAEADIIFVFNPFPPDTMRAVREQIGTVARRKPLAVFDYGGMVTQGIKSLVPVVACDLAPYRLVCSRNFLEESRALVDIPAPNPKRKRGGRPAL